MDFNYSPHDTTKWDRRLQVVNWFVGMAKKENAISAFNDMFVRFYEGHICKL